MNPARAASIALCEMPRCSGGSGRTETYSASPSLSHTGAWSSRRPMATWVSSWRISRSPAQAPVRQQPGVQHEPGRGQRRPARLGGHREGHAVQRPGVAAREVGDRGEVRRVGERVDHHRPGPVQRHHPGHVGDPLLDVGQQPVRVDRRCARRRCRARPGPVRTTIGPASHGWGRTSCSASQPGSRAAATAYCPGAPVEVKREPVPAQHRPVVEAGQLGAQLDHGLVVVAVADDRGRVERVVEDAERELGEVGEVAALLAAQPAVARGQPAQEPAGVVGQDRLGALVERGPQTGLHVGRRRDGCVGAGLRVVLGEDRAAGEPEQQKGERRRRDLDRMVGIDRRPALGEGGDVLDDAEGDGLRGEPDLLEDRGPLGVVEELLRDRVQPERRGAPRRR